MKSWFYQSLRLSVAWWQPISPYRQLSADCCLDRRAKLPRPPHSNKARSTVDHFVGMRIRERRRALGLTQRELAESAAADLTPQQLHNYELGKNGVSSGMLYEIARALRTSPECFFEGLDTDHPVTQETSLQRLMNDLMRSLGELKSGEHLEAIGHLTRGLAAKARSKRRPRRVLER
jgi:transcriptional regulator with XRE-family HTH domain